MNNLYEAISELIAEEEEIIENQRAILIEEGRSDVMYQLDFIHESNLYWLTRAQELAGMENM